MSSVTAAMVQELRKRTGVGMSKCKEALVEASGNVEAAIDYLRKKGVASAVKKSARETNEGAVGLAQNDESLAMVEINAETDFVTQNDMFKEFLKNMCAEVLATKPASESAFLEQKYSKEPSLTIEEVRAEFMQTIGENIVIRRLKLIPKVANASYGIYSHMNGKIVVAVELSGSGDVADVARDVAMHAAAESPEYISPEEIPADIKAREEEIAREQVKNKPANIIDKIIEGKLRSFYDQVCLPFQKFVKDPSVTVGQYIADCGKKSGHDITLTRFVRWQVGE